jgi:hypothetical protein
MTKTEFFNLALHHLGITQRLTDAEITADLKPQAKVLNDFFIPFVRSVFQEHQWAFATVQEELVAASEEVPLGWTFAYDYPTANAATIWTVFNEGTLIEKDKQDFDTYYLPTTDTRLIVSNLDEAYAEYTYIIEDVESWREKFAVAMSYSFAATVSSAVTGDAEKGLKLLAVYGTLIADVKRIDASEKRKKPQQTSGYQQARG